MICVLVPVLRKYYTEKIMRTLDESDKDFVQSNKPALKFLILHNSYAFILLYGDTQSVLHVFIGLTKLLTNNGNFEMIYSFHFMLFIICSYRTSLAIICFGYFVILK